MTIHIETSGNPTNPPLVLLHGWGLHGGFWPELVAHLEQDYYCLNIDLPGHGNSAEQCWTLTQLSQQLSQHIPAQSIVIGWSLGGLVAQHFALNYPQGVKALVLVASTPRFLRAPDWPHAAKHDAFDALSAGLEDDFETVVSDFMKLTLLSGSRPTVKWSTLKARAFERGTPSAKALQAGLNILAASDFRFHVERIYVPALCISGEHDRLTPPEASAFMAEQMPRGEWFNIKGAGHAPYLSHPDVFNQKLDSWLAAL